MIKEEDSHACETKRTDLAPYRKNLKLQCAEFLPLEKPRRKHIADHWERRTRKKIHLDDNPSNVHQTNTFMACVSCSRS